MKHRFTGSAGLGIWDGGKDWNIFTENGKDRMCLTHCGIGVSAQVNKEICIDQKVS